MKVTAATQTSVSLAWTASTDDVARQRATGSISPGQAHDARPPTPPPTSRGCSAARPTRSVSTPTTPPASARRVASCRPRHRPAPPRRRRPATGTVTQTIANGSTLSNLVNWRAVYDRNGDKVEDDPGTIAVPRRRQPGALRDQPALRRHLRQLGLHHRQQRPHTFQVRALNDSGTLLATNTITATIDNQTPPPPPPTSSTGTVTQTIANGSTLSESRQLARRLRQQRRQGRGRPRHDRSSSSTATRCCPRSTPPFGDTFANGSITVNNGQHTFQVRALNDSGTLLATNTVTATINNQTTPPPPTGDTIASVAAEQPQGRVGDRRRASRSRGTPPPTTSPSPATTSTAARASMGTTPQTTATFSGLTCGTGYPVGVDAFDAAGNASPQATMTVTTSACADTQPPTAPTNVTASTRTTTSIEPHLGARHRQRRRRRLRRLQRRRPRRHHRRHHRHRQRPHLRHQLHPRRRRLRRNRQQLPQDRHHGLHPPLHRHHPTHTADKPRTTSATTTSLTLAWNASTDNVAVAGYDIYRAKPRSAPPPQPPTA